MPLTNYSHQALLNSLAGNTSNFGALASAPTIYVALSTSAPNMDGTGVTEPSGATVSDYARVETAAADWAAATDADPSVLANAQAIEFPQLTTASEDWGTVTHFALYDAATNGNLLGYGALGTPKNPTEGDTPSFSVGDLEIRLGSPS